MFVSIPWYETEQDFMAILDLVPFEESQDACRYAQWVKNIEEFEDGIRQSGNVPFRVKIEIAPLKAWVEANDLTICRAAISRYATDQLAKRLL